MSGGHCGQPEDHNLQCKIRMVLGGGKKDVVCCYTDLVVGTHVDQCLQCKIRRVVVGVKEGIGDGLGVVVGLY